MLPTPLQPADRLGSAIGLAAGRLFVKRDDLTCFVAVYPSREQAVAGAANPAS